MNDPTLWWFLAGFAVLIELFTGSFYLLIWAIGFAAAALLGQLGAGPIAQVLAAALLIILVTLAWYVVQRQRAKQPSSNQDLNLDIGEIVHIEAWNSDGTATVKYRGAQWTAVYRPGNPPSTGAHRIAEMIGNRLLVDKV